MTLIDHIVNDAISAAPVANSDTCCCDAHDVAGEILSVDATAIKKGEEFHPICPFFSNNAHHIFPDSTNDEKRLQEVEEEFKSHRTRPDLAVFDWGVLNEWHGRPIEMKSDRMLHELTPKQLLIPPHEYNILEKKLRDEEDKRKNTETRKSEDVTLLSDGLEGN
mmetsp:Transcript_6002/g.22754  ORF Transcript_6002/g.22754 Transcript_6002/m.22754 type:complete len:164 (+) Transcript_6002:1507-1998(+)